MATSNCLVSNILQKIFLCSAQEKKSSLDELEGEWIRDYDMTDTCQSKSIVTTVGMFT